MHLFDFSEMQGDIPADIAELVSRIREIRLWTASAGPDTGGSS